MKILKESSTEDINKVFKAYGLKDKINEPYTTANNYVKNIKRCTILENANIVYSTSTVISE